MATFNSKLRKVVYGAGPVKTNPLLNLPAGVTGTTWHGTGFEQPPGEPVELDQTALPWELQEEPAVAAAEDTSSGALLGFSALGVLLGAVAVALIFIGA